MSASATVLPGSAMHQQTRTFHQQLVRRALHDQRLFPRADLSRPAGTMRTPDGRHPMWLDPGEAQFDLLKPTPAPGAHGAPPTACHCIGLPEREGVGER